MITTLRIRQTKKDEQMAWLTLTDRTGAIECAIAPNAFARLGQLSTASEVAAASCAHRSPLDRSGGEDYVSA